MASPTTNYRTLSESNPFRNPDVPTDTESPNDHEDTPRNSGVHIVHIVPETKARWNHIEDLDSFFTQVYNYHQKHGFTVILLDEVFQLFEVAFVVWLFTLTVHCINYSILFGTVKPDPNSDRTKVTIADTVIPMGECVMNFGALTYLIFFLATLYFIIRLFKMIYNITQYADIKKFYNSALHIEDTELENITWFEVKKRIREVQAEHHMCIDKEQLTELDIYHRILRFKNYMVALMNKNLLPARYNMPIFGEVVSLSRGLLVNIDFILFRSPGSPFQNNWQLRDDYAIRSNQRELAQRLSQMIVWVAVANLILAPVIFLWQLIYFTFSYANILRKEPGALGMRTWSNYGRLYLRHFNELDHELDARLNRAYEYADRYISSFSSPIMAVIAKNLLFVSGGLLVLILLLGIYDEFVFQVEHVLTIITILTVIGIVCRLMIPDENLIFCPEQLMTAILAHVHYLPSNWKNQAHTTLVRAEFGRFFQFKAFYLLNEIFSPLVTPFVLLFVFKPKALEIVKFFRSFTVTVRGVGNVCSFAQMDVRKHGNPEWQIQTSVAGVSIPENVDEDIKKQYPAEHGKTELSLVRFSLTNPEWQMPQEAENFIKGIRENALQDLLKAKQTNADEGLNPMTESLYSFGSIAEEYSPIACSVLNNHNIWHPPNKRQPGVQPQYSGHGVGFEQMLQQNLGDQSRDSMPSTSRFMTTSSGVTDRMRKLRVFKRESGPEGPSESLLYNIYGLDPKLANLQTDVAVADMCLSTLYLHEIHKQRKKSKQSQSIDAVPRIREEPHNIVSSKAEENTPLLSNIRS